MTSCDFLLIGGGVIGLSIAREPKNRHHTARITLIKKRRYLWRAEEKRIPLNTRG